MAANGKIITTQLAPNALQSQIFKGRSSDFWAALHHRAPARRPTPTRVTFLNGRAGDISIGWTHTRPACAMRELPPDIFEARRSGEMSLLDIILDKITEADINDVISNSVPESATIDYKRETYGNSDNDKREFLADVSSFANTIGGDIVIGLDEASG